MYVNARSTGGFRVTAQPKFVQNTLKDDCNLLHCRVRRFDRIKIEHEIVRIIEVLNTRQPRDVLNSSHISEIKQLLAIRSDEISNVAGHILGPDLLRTNPAGCVIRCVFLIERLAMNAVGKSFEYEGTIHEVRYQIRRDVVVILD